MRPFAILDFSTAQSDYIKCASSVKTSTKIRLAARLRALEIDAAIDYRSGEYSVLKDIAHDQSVPEQNRAHAKQLFYQLCYSSNISDNATELREDCDTGFSWGTESTASTPRTEPPRSEAKPIVTKAPSQCSKPDADAAVTGQPYGVIYPAVEQAKGITGTAQIKINLDKTGAVIDVSIFRSTGNNNLDNAALQSAKTTTFSPSIRNCEAVPDSYLYSVQFDPL